MARLSCMGYSGGGVWRGLGPREGQNESGMVQGRALILVLPDTPPQTSPLDLTLLIYSEPFLL